jgi:hypothetical protein
VPPSRRVDGSIRVQDHGNPLASTATQKINGPLCSRACHLRSGARAAAGRKSRDGVRLRAGPTQCAAVALEVEEPMKANVAEKPAGTAGLA